MTRPEHAPDDDLPATARDSPLAWMLRQFRKRAGLSQEQLADATGISARSISDIERGATRTPQKGTIDRLVRGLRLNNDDAQRFERIAAPATRPPGHPATDAPATLPTPTTSLVGRTAVVDDIVTALAAGTRVLTITGPGGVGKTRVALDVARRWAAATAEPVAFVPLAHLRDAALLLPAVAETVEVRSDGVVPLHKLLADHLAVQPTLLVVDNVEQMAGAPAEIAALLDTAPPLRVLVTSRTVLRIGGELVYPLESLAVPRGSEPTDAVQLFLDRALAAAPVWEPSAADFAAIGELCRIVDGVPLAIEIAAVWTRAIRPTELLTRARPALRLLSRGAHDAPDRHRSLRATVSWSVDLLDDDARALFARLSVWPADWTLTAAEQVCGDDGLDVMTATADLVDANLVRAAPRLSGTRYSMSTVIREFAHELLAADGQADAVIARHTAETIRWVGSAHAKLTGPDQRRALAALELEHRNVQGVLERSLIAGDGDTALTIAGHMWRFWEARGYLVEGRRWLQRALQVPGPVDPRIRAVALNAAGNLARDQVDGAAAVAHYQEALALFQAAGDRRRAAGTENNLGNIALDEGDLQTAERHHRAALDATLADGDRHQAALLRNNLALTLRRVDPRSDEIVSLLEGSIAAFTDLGDVRGHARAVESLGRVLDVRGEPSAAARRHIESIALRRTAGDDHGLVHSAEGLARSLAALGLPRLAARLLGHTARLREIMGNPRTTDDDEDISPTLTSIIAAVGHDELAAELAAGAEDRLDDILDTVDLVD